MRENPTSSIIYFFYPFVKNEVRIIKPESKILSFVLKGVVVLLVLLTIFLIIVSAVFYAGDNAPSLFGHNVYLVKTDAFSLIKNGTALITEEVDYSEIKAGNIVVYSTEDGKAAVAEIREANVYDGVYTYNAKSADDTDIYIGQSSIIGKGMFFSDTFGAVISFAVSPAGVAIIAIVPCLMIIAFEVVKYFKKKLPQPEIETVKKQEETPTYVPNRRLTPQSRPVQQYEHMPAPPVMDIVIPANPDDTDITKPAFAPQPKREQVINSANPFFQPPRTRVQQKPQAEQQQPMRNTAPISSRKLDEIIAQTKAEHGQVRAPSPVMSTLSLDEQRERERTIREIQQKRASALVDAQSPKVHVPTGIVKEATQPGRTISAPEGEVKQYVPRKSPAERKSSSPLDRLLREEHTSDQRYNIDDILKSIEKKY